MVTYQSNKVKNVVCGSRELTEQRDVTPSVKHWASSVQQCHATCGVGRLTKWVRKTLLDVHDATAVLQK